MADFLGAGTSGPSALRSLLADSMATRQPLVLPGCYDALGARLIEQTGFDAVYMTGFGTSASLLGRPDVGLLGLTEMVDNARRISAATHLPVVADADTGYGNQINVVRTVHEFERAGVAGIHLEDQVLPKRCGHMEDKQVVDRAEMVGKIEAAAAARQDPDFVLIARTDARSPHGLEEAIDRAGACLDAGADVLFVEALEGVGEIERVADEFAGTPLLFNWVEGGKSPSLDYGRLAELGFAMIIVPIGTLLAATRAIQGYLDKLRTDGTPVDIMDGGMAFPEFTDTIGLPEIVDLERRFST